VGNLGKSSKFRHLKNRLRWERISGYGVGSSSTRDCLGRASSRAICLRNLGLLLSLGLTSCFRNPFGGPQGELGQRFFTRLNPLQTTSQTSGSAGTLAISLGDQIISRLESDLKAGGLTDQQIQAIAAEARKEVQAEAGKIVISTLHEIGLGLSQYLEYDLLDQTAELMAKISSAVARGAVRSLAADDLKGLAPEFKQNTVGILSSSVMASISISPQKLSDTGISSIASSLIDSLVSTLPDAGFSGEQLLSGMAQVMEKAVGSLDEAGLSTEGTGDAVVAVTQTTLQKATEITKGTASEGRCIGSVAAAAIQGLAATKASATQSLTAIENVTTVSVKVVVSLDTARVDLAQSIENLTNLTTKAVTVVTSSSDTIGGVEKLMGAATKAAAEATAAKPNDLFAKITAGIVAGSVSAVDAVVAKSGAGAAAIVKTMVTTTATKAVENSANPSDVVKLLTEVTGSAVKALAKSTAIDDASVKSAAVGSAIEGTVSALSKISDQNSNITSAAIQGISKAGTQAVAAMTSDAATISQLTQQIVQSGISSASTSLSGNDSTKLVSLASDMTRGAASGIATMQGIDLSAQVSTLASTAVQAVNQATSQLNGTAEVASVLSTFATSVASAITSGLAVGGQDSSAITSINATLSQTIVQTVATYAPSVDTTSLSEKVQTQAQNGADLANTLIKGEMALCEEKFPDDLNLETFMTRLEGKLSNVFCRVTSTTPKCPKARGLAAGDFYWVLTPPDLCEFRFVPVSTNTAVKTEPVSTQMATSSSTGTSTTVATNTFTATNTNFSTANGTFLGTGTPTSTATGTGTGLSSNTATGTNSSPDNSDYRTGTSTATSSDTAIETDIGTSSGTWIATSIDMENGTDTSPTISLMINENLPEINATNPYYYLHGSCEPQGSNIMLTTPFNATTTCLQGSFSFILETSQLSMGAVLFTVSNGNLSEQKVIYKVSPPPSLDLVRLKFVSDTTVEIDWTLDETEFYFSSYIVFRSNNSTLNTLEQAFQLTPIYFSSTPTSLSFYDNNSGLGLSPNQTYSYAVVGWNAPQGHIFLGHIEAHTGPTPLNVTGTSLLDGNPPLGFFSHHSQLHWVLSPEGGDLIFKVSPNNNNISGSWIQFYSFKRP